MIPVETMLLFFAASTALAVAPGPDNIFVLTQSALYGPRAGIAVTLGLCTGLLVHTAMVALGVAVLFQNSALAFDLLKTAGALYLLYLAWQAFRAGAAELHTDNPRRIPPLRLYLRGIVMNVTNPKVALFFLAFLPQFTDPAQGSVTLQIALLGGIFIIATLLVFGSVAWFAGALGEWLAQRPGAHVVMHRVAGTLFVALAIKLILVEQ